jgi:hypothetical protein
MVSLRNLECNSIGSEECLRDVGGMLLYWCVQTTRRFRELLQQRYKRINEGEKG